MQIIRRNITYLIFLCFVIMLIGLLFNDNVWFDETYTLALIRHSYGEMIDILKSDMHPPLYFIGLKFFCSIFGYHIIVTKIFSAIGFSMLLMLGCCRIRNDYGNTVSVFYLLVAGAVPFSFYFGVQQRCYSWAMLFVAWCFLEGIRLIREGKWRTVIPFSISALGAAYNHIYALVAVAGIVLCVNGVICIKRRTCLYKIIVADAIMVLGYWGWLRVLLLQTQKAAKNFWQTSLEVDSLIVFFITLFLFVGLLIKNRKNNVVNLGIFCIMFVHVTGFAVSLLVRPLYVARYAAPLLGVFAFVIAIFVGQGKEKIRQRICHCLFLLFILEYIAVAAFEYNASLRNFRQEFDKIVSSEDIFLYNDSSFGIMSYYYPENRHICIYWQDWFSAFENVEYRLAKDIPSEVLKGQNIWFVINEKSAIPEQIKEQWTCEKVLTFRSDFNKFGVWHLK